MKDDLSSSNSHKGYLGSLHGENDVVTTVMHLLFDE